MKTLFKQLTKEHQDILMESDHERIEEILTDLSSTSFFTEIKLYTAFSVHSIIYKDLFDYTKLINLFNWNSYE